jgi:hypothetical protein
LGRVEFQSEVVPADEPIESPLRLFIPPEVRYSTVGFEESRNRGLRFDRLLVEVGADAAFAMEAIAANGPEMILFRHYEFKPISGVKVTVQGGAGQTAAPNQQVPAPLSVKVTDASGSPLAGILVSFAVIQGSANILAPAQSLTDSTGVASAFVVMGPLSGPVTVKASATGTPVAFTIASSGPGVAPGGITGIGGSIPAVTAITPGALLSIYGTNFAPAGTGRRVNATELAKGVLPNVLLGVCVTVGGLPAPMMDVYPNQINAVAPAVTPGTAVQVSVTTGCNTSAAVQSMPQFVTVQTNAPEFLYFQLSAAGKNPVAAVNAVTGALVWLGRTSSADRTLNS